MQTRKAAGTAVKRKIQQVDIPPTLYPNTIPRSNPDLPQPPGWSPAEATRAPGQEAKEEARSRSKARSKARPKANPSSTPESTPGDTSRTPYEIADSEKEAKRKEAGSKGKARTKCTGRIHKHKKAPRNRSRECDAHHDYESDNRNEQEVGHKTPNKRTGKRQRRIAEGLNALAKCVAESIPIERGAINLTGSQIPTAIQAVAGLGHSFQPCPKPLPDAKVLANFEDLFRGISNSTIALAEYGPAQPAPRLYLSTGGTLLPEDRDLSVELASANMEFKAVIDAAALANPVGDATHKDMNRRNVTSGEGAAIKSLKSNSTKGKQITPDAHKICNPPTNHGSTVSQALPQALPQYNTKTNSPTDLLTMRSDKEPAASIIYRKQADALLAEELKAYIKIPNTTQHDIETGLSAQGHEIISDAIDFADPNEGIMISEHAQIRILTL